MRADFVFIFLLASSACYPGLPTHFAEGTEVLEARRASLTFVGGGAALNTSLRSSTTGEAGGGLETRVRVGVGHNQEVGGSFVAAIATSAGSGDPPFIFGGKLTYKFAPTKWLALIADGGGVDQSAASIVVMGGDLGVIVAPYTTRNGTQIYTGARGSFAVPVLHQAHAVDESLTVPLGLSIHINDHIRFILESGLVVGFGQLTDDSSSSSSLNNTSTLGGYGVLAFSYRFGNATR